MGFLLYYIAVLLMLILYGIMFPISAVLGWRGTNRRLENSALMIDVLANVLFAPAWNLLFISRLATHRFGKLWETLSEVLGWAEREKTLTRIGRLIVYLLHRLDPFHCQWAIGLRPKKPVRKWWQVALAILEVTIIVFSPIICFMLIKIAQS